MPRTAAAPPATRNSRSGVRSWSRLGEKSRRGPVSGRGDHSWMASASTWRCPPNHEVRERACLWRVLARFCTATATIARREYQDIDCTADGLMDGRRRTSSIMDWLVGLKSDGRKERLEASRKETHRGETQHEGWGASPFFELVAAHFPRPRLRSAPAKPEGPTSLVKEKGKCQLQTACRKRTRRPGKNAGATTRYLNARGTRPPSQLSMALYPWTRPQEEHHRTRQHHPLIH